MRLVRDLRLIPVVAIAAAALFVLKTSALLIEGGYTLVAARTAQAQGLGEGPRASAPLRTSEAVRTSEGQRANPLSPPAALDQAPAAPRGDLTRSATPPAASNSWVRDLYTPPEDVTGSVAAPKPAEPPKDAAAAAPPPEPVKPQVSAGERAVLESLQQRRQELEARARELEVRDSLLKAAEKRIEQRLQELKDAEARLAGASSKKEEAEVAKFKSLVSMYENMKAKDAAKIFDRLDLRILVEVVNAMNPRRMSDILGVMQTDAAERLTVELANRSGAVAAPPSAPPVELPKIEGRPRS